MKAKLSIVAISFLFTQIMYSQLVINELDCDTPGVDDREFIEIRSETPYFALDEFIVVFFNGSASGGNRSYLAIDMHGYTTDINGLLLIGSDLVSPAPQLVISPNLIQNGADAAAIYKADTSSFSYGTLATNYNLVDALGYDTNDPDATTLMALLGLTEQINEGQNGKKDTESIQRNDDGSYFVGLPTPRQLNDGSGVVLNGINISVEKSGYMEGEQFDLVLTSELTVQDDLVLQLSLSNGTFNQTDYSGDTTFILPKGQNMVKTTIQIIDDADDEGDELMVIKLAELPETFLALKNNIVIRIIDNDYTVAPFGSPVNPTYGAVENLMDPGYYESINGLSGADLKTALTEIVANTNGVRAQTYADIIDILKQADQNPENSNQVWLVYTEQGRAMLDLQTGSDSQGKWNREHTFPRSRGGFFSIEADETADGKEVYWQTNADSTRHGNSDAHALRAADGTENTIRGNQHYGQYNGPFGNSGSFKGDVARSVFYMTIRYNGLEVVNGFPEIQGQMGDLATLLEWHRNDPPDDFEMNRNNIVYSWQYNRNPFIDFPDLVEYLWGNKKNEIWPDPVTTFNQVANEIRIFPNPAHDLIFIKGLTGENRIELRSMDKLCDVMTTHEPEAILHLNESPGLYILTICNNEACSSSKIILN